MRPRQRTGRTLFLTFACSSYVAVMAPVPLLKASAQATGEASRGASTSRQPTYPSFEFARALAFLDDEK